MTSTDSEIDELAKGLNGVQLSDKKILKIDHKVATFALS